MQAAAAGYVGGWCAYPCVAPLSSLGALAWLQAMTQCVCCRWVCARGVCKQGLQCVRASCVCYMWVLSAAAAANTTVVLQDCLECACGRLWSLWLQIAIATFLQVLGVVLPDPLQPGATPDHCRGVSCPLLLADTARGVQQIRLVGSSCAACLSTKAVYCIQPTRATADVVEGLEMSAVGCGFSFPL